MSELFTDREKTIYRVTFVGFAVNMILSALKMAAGVLGRSSAMIADAVHSLSDVATDLVVLVFVRISSKPRDDSHDYGHGKYETVATIIIGVALLAVAVGLGYEGTTKVLAYARGEELPQPEAIAFWVALVSIAAKEILYRYTVRIGRRVESSSVIANAWHHRSDAFSSVGTAVGIGLAVFLGAKWRVADPAAAIVVALLIIKVALELIKTGVDELLEKSLSKSVEDEILAIITSDHAVCDPHNLRTRRIGSCISIEVHVRVDAQMTVGTAHALTENIEHSLRQRFGEGTFLSIHVEPIK